MGPNLLANRAKFRARRFGAGRSILIQFVSHLIQFCEIVQSKRQYFKFNGANS